MFDALLRPIIDKPLNKIGMQLVHMKITANQMTVLGFIFGLCAMTSIVMGQFFIAALFILCNRISDGLDGAIARNTHLTDFGGFLDIVCDFIIYSGIVFSFGVAFPQYTLHVSFLIFSFIGPITSFLAYAIIANKYQIETQLRGKKSFYYLGGICEGTETAIFMLLLCLFTNCIPQLCIIYGCLCWLTTAGRIYAAWTDFGYHKDYHC